MSEEVINAEIVEPCALMQLEKAQIDMQIATAHQYPRSMHVFKTKAIDMACIDEETAESCIYKRPVGGGKTAEGKSVRMAEIVGASYGNLRVAARIVEQTDRQVIAQGVAHDLESNFLSTSEVVEATVKRDGTPYDERMRVVVAKAALAKARRDATFQVVPAALCKPVEKAVRELLFGDQKSLSERRKNAELYISKLPVGKDRVYAALGIGGAADLGVEELETLTGLKCAIRDGDATIDEAFPALECSPVESGELLGEDDSKKSKKVKEQKEEPVHIDAETLPAAALPAAINTHKKESYFLRVMAEFGTDKANTLSEDKQRACLKAMLAEQDAE